MMSCGRLVLSRAEARTFSLKVKVNSENVSHSVVSDSAIPWTVACQAPLSMGFSRQEYWSGLPFPLPKDLPDPGIEPEYPALQAVYLLSVPLFGKPNWKPNFLCFILILQKSRKTEERMSFSDHLQCEQLAIRGLWALWSTVNAHFIQCTKPCIKALQPWQHHHL